MVRPRHAHPGSCVDSVGLHAQLFRHKFIGYARRRNHCLDERRIVLMTARVEHVFEKLFWRIDNAFGLLLIGAGRGPGAAADERRAAGEPQLFQNHDVKPRAFGVRRCGEPAAPCAENDEIVCFVPFIRHPDWRCRCSAERSSCRCAQTQLKKITSADHRLFSLLFEENSSLSIISSPVRKYLAAGHERRTCLRRP